MKNQEIAELLGLVPRESEPDPEEAETYVTDFDGGARQTAPAQSDPEADHGAFLLELIHQTPRGSSGGW